MGKYKLIERDPNQGEMEDLKSLINNDLSIFIGSNFAEELEDVFNTLDDTLEEKEDKYLEQIDELEKENKRLKEQINEAEEEVDGLGRQVDELLAIISNSKE